MSGVWSQFQATLGKTSQGAWVGWEDVPDQIRDSSDTTVSRQRDYVETEGDRAEVETMGEGSDVSQGTGEGAKGCSAANEEGTEEKDGERVSVRKQRKMNNGRERHLSWLRGDNSAVLRESES